MDSVIPITDRFYHLGLLAFFAGNRVFLAMHRFFVAKPTGFCRHSRQRRAGLTVVRGILAVKIGFSGHATGPANRGLLRS